MEARSLPADGRSGGVNAVSSGDSCGGSLRSNCGRSESPRCPSSCRACWHCVRRSDTADSTNDGRDRTRPFCLAVPRGGPWGSMDESARETMKTSRPSTPDVAGGVVEPGTRSRGTRRPTGSVVAVSAGVRTRVPCQTFIRCRRWAQFVAPREHLRCASPPRCELPLGLGRASRPGAVGPASPQETTTGTDRRH